MLTVIPNLLSAEDIAHCRHVLETSDWVDGKVTAGPQSARAKHNLQVPETAPQAKALGDMILTRLGRHPIFLSAVLPAKVVPPLFISTTPSASAAQAGRAIAPTCRAPCS
jgi:PKHD-type hydroxylase